MSATPRRMLDAALARLHDAGILAESFRAESDADSLVSILAFEILLKCALLLSGASSASGHGYWKLWNKLPENARREILSVAHARMPGHADLADIQKLLQWYQYIFEKARYPYELFEGYSAQEEDELTQLWLDLGAPVDEALVQYYPMELTCLIAGLRAYVEQRVP